MMLKRIETALADVDTRTALRATIAAFIAQAVGDLAHLPRSYWAVLVSVLLINGTWGQNVQKSLTRLGMTTLGCLIALGLHELTAASRPATISVMLIAVYLAAFFRTGSYALMTLSVTVYVVFLFALLGIKSASITRIRAYQTAIGCGVAVAASLIVPPVRSQREGERVAEALWQSCREQIAAAFDSLLGTGPDSPPNSSAPRTLLAKLFDLRTHRQAARFEGLIFGRNRVPAYEKVRLLTRLTLALRAAVTEMPVQPALPAALAEEMRALRDQALRSLESPAWITSKKNAAESPATAEPNSESDNAAGATLPSITSLHRVMKTMEQLRREGMLSRQQFAAIAPIVLYAAQIADLAQSASGVA